jgi:putative membrane protein
MFIVPARPNVHLGFDVKILPFIYANLNAATAVLLCISLYFIKKQNIAAHKTTNLIAVIFSALFLVLYVAYHALAPATKFGDANHDGLLDATEKALVGGLRYFYYALLLLHIVISIAILPMVLFTLTHAFQNNVAKHRKLAKITWPLWLFVAISGVVVYVLISKYY